METQAIVETQKKQNELIVREAERLTVITSEAEYAQGRELLKHVKAARAEWKETMDPIREAQHAAWKITCDTIKMIDEPLRRAQARLENYLNTYETVLESHRKAEQEKLLAESKKQTEDVILSQAEELAESGRTQEAEQLLSQADTFAAPAEAAVKKDVDTGKRQVWFAEVVDLMALVKAVAAGQAPLNYLVPNEAALNQRARGDQAEMRVPGVRALSKFTYPMERKK